MKKLIQKFLTIKNEIESSVFHGLQFLTTLPAFEVFASSSLVNGLHCLMDCCASLDFVVLVNRVK